MTFLERVVLMTMVAPWKKTVKRSFDVVDVEGPTDLHPISLSYQFSARRRG